jgi:hypothetical protein
MKWQYEAFAKASPPQARFRDSAIERMYSSRSGSASVWSGSLLMPLMTIASNEPFDFFGLSLAGRGPWYGATPKQLGSGCRAPGAGLFGSSLMPLILAADSTQRKSPLVGGLAAFPRLVGSFEYDFSRMAQEFKRSGARASS